MENKNGAGRKMLPNSERKSAVIIYVKNKYKAKAKMECLKIQTKYEKL